MAKGWAVASLGCSGNQALRVRNANGLFESQAVKEERRRGLSTTALWSHSHWLGPPQEECDLGSKAEAGLED